MEAKNIMETPRTNRISRSVAAELLEAKIQGERQQQALLGDENGAVSPEASSDYNDYLESRPKKATDKLFGDAVHPTSGVAIDSKKYFDAKRDMHMDSSGEATYKDLSMSELARLLAEAEFTGDKTRESNISDVLIEKMSEVSEGLGNKDRSASKHFNDNGEQDPQEAFWNRVMSIKDKRLAELQEKREAETSEYQEPSVTNHDGPNSHGYEPSTENGKYLPEVTEQEDDLTQEMPAVTRSGILKRAKDKIKEALKKSPAVRFDGKDHNGVPIPGKLPGDAIVDERDRDYETKHVVALVGLGVLAVGAAYLATRGIHSPIIPGGGPPKGYNPDLSGVPSGHIPGDETLKHVAETFTVERGNGYTHELIDFAQSRNVKLGPTQAYELHQHLVDTFGADYIDINGPGADIYRQSGDIRLSEPGTAQFIDGVDKEIENWLKSK